MSSFNGQRTDEFRSEFRKQQRPSAQRHLQRKRSSLWIWDDRLWFSLSLLDPSRTRLQISNFRFAQTNHSFASRFSRKQFPSQFYFRALLLAYIRFAQCIRRAIDSPKRRGHHLQNAAKYSTSFLKVAMSYALYYSGKAPAAFGFWIVTNVIASVFTLVWDLRMDWGLLHLEKVL